MLIFANSKNRAGALKMESLGPECTKLKQKYEACFYQWYSEKYLTGKSKEDECAPLFKEYRECLEVRKLKDNNQLQPLYIFACLCPC